MTNYRTTIQSLVNFRNSQGVSARGTILRLSRSTVIFEVYNPYSIVQLSEVLEQFSIRRGDRAIYTGRAVVSNLVSTGLMLIVSVNLIDAWSDLSGLLESGRGISDEVLRFIDDFDSISGVNAGYQLVVTRLRTFLAELGRWLEQVDMEAGVSANPSQGLQDKIFLEIAEPLFPRLSRLFGDFEEEARTIPDNIVSYHKAYAQRDLHPLLLRVPFIHRTFSKPLGYAGDFEMVNMMYRNQREGPNTYAQILHSFYVNSSVCQAHRNRVHIMRDRLAKIAGKVESGGCARVLNIGCGPAHEVLRFIREESLSERFHIELLDFSQETLDATHESVVAAILESGHHPKVEYIQESVHNLLRYASRPDSSGRNGRYDFIYCAGLFDYLSDRVCSRLISLFGMWIKRDGMVLATNVHSRNEYRGVMEHILEWHLIHRDEAQMKSLASPRCIKKLYTDDTGMNVFLEIAAPDAL